MIMVRINKTHTLGINVGFAVKAGSFILRHSSGRDDDEAVPRVSVPAGAPSRLPNIALDVQMRRSWRLLES
jgi:hypothetical protein